MGIIIIIIIIVANFEKYQLAIISELGSWKKERWSIETNFTDILVITKHIKKSFSTITMLTLHLGLRYVKLNFMEHGSMFDWMLLLTMTNMGGTWTQVCWAVHSINHS